MAKKVTSGGDPSVKSTAPKERPEPMATTTPRGPQQSASNKPKRDGNG